MSHILGTVQVTFDEQHFAIEWRVGIFLNDRVAGDSADIISADLILEKFEDGRPGNNMKDIRGCEGS